MNEHTSSPAVSGRGHEPSGGKRKRASRRQVRAWAWMAGSLSFLAPLAAFGLSPKPAQGQTIATPGVTRSRPRRPVVLVITKKIVYQRAAAPSTTSGGGVNYVYAPSSPAVAVSCGTHPC